MPTDFTPDMNPFLFRLYRVLRCLRLTRSPSALKVLSRHPKLELAAFEARGGRIYIRGTEVEVTSEARQFLLRGSDCILRLMAECQAVFRTAQDGVELEVQGVRLLLENWEELFIAKDVFADGVYNIHPTRPFVLIDVGMNVGTTSLYFASRQACTAAHGFELFPPTADKALKNLSLNPDIAGKITSRAVGLAAKASTTELDYLDEYKGSSGKWGLPEYINCPDAAAKTRRVAVRFADCAATFTEILQRHRGQMIVCKLDCEGAEYEILESLAGCNLLGGISCFMIEWHRNGPAPLEKILRGNGFTTFSLSPGAPTHSMVYAWRQAEQPVAS